MRAKEGEVVFPSEVTTNAEHYGYPYVITDDFG